MKAQLNALGAAALILVLLFVGPIVHGIGQRWNVYSNCLALIEVSKESTQPSSSKAPGLTYTPVEEADTLPAPPWANAEKNAAAQALDREMNQKCWKQAARTVNGWNR